MGNGNTVFNDLTYKPMDYNFSFREDDPFRMVTGQRASDIAYTPPDTAGGNAIASLPALDKRAEIATTDSVEDKGLTSGQAGGIGMIAEGLGNVLTGVIGGRKRRREQAAAREKLRERMRGFENMDYYGTVMANPFEDMTVNQLQAQFQARQSQQGLANTLGALQGAAGGSGVAGLAQAMAQQQSMNMAQISANIGQQEARNQQLIGQGNYMRSLAVERAEQRVRDKNETLLALAVQRKAIADQARKDATTALAGGVGQIIGGGAQLALGMS